MSTQETLIKVENCGKLFCRDLKRSLWYGTKDAMGDIVPWIHRGLDENGTPLIRKDEFWANKDISFEVKRGECIGLIGHNGAGKTTLLKMLSGLIKPDTGSIEIRGRVGALIALGAGFNPVLTARENIFINGAVLGISTKEIKSKFDDIVDFAEIEEFIDTPVQYYSSGMQVRLGFAIATSFKPDVLLLDEVLAVGDSSFHSKCYKRIGNIINDCAVIFVSHDAYSIRRICDQVVLLHRGQQQFLGSTEKGMEKYAQLRHSEAEQSPIIFKDQSIHSVEVENYTESKASPLTIIFKVKFNSDFSSKTGIPHGNILANDESIVGQFDLADTIPLINEGLNELNISIPNFEAGKGQYSVNINIFSNNRKKVLLRIHHCITFHITESKIHGAHVGLLVK